MTFVPSAKDFLPWISTIFFFPDQFSDSLRCAYLLVYFNLSFWTIYVE